MLNAIASRSDFCLEKQIAGPISIMLHSRLSRDAREHGSSLSTRPTADARACCPVVATDQDVWSTITDVANVDNTDVLVDIGCGDGQFITHAARFCKCQCIGLDVRESCLQRTKKMADRNGVRHLVDVIEQDFTDLVGLQRVVDRATVLYAFLLPHVIREIEPVLLRAVENGKRVVLFCSTGGRTRRLDQQAKPYATKPGNAIGDLVPTAIAWFGRLRCYGAKEAADIGLTTHTAPAASMPLRPSGLPASVAMRTMMSPQQQPPLRWPISLRPISGRTSRPSTGTDQLVQSWPPAQVELSPSPPPPPPPPPQLLLPLPLPPAAPPSPPLMAALTPQLGLPRISSRSQLILPSFIQTRLVPLQARPAARQAYVPPALLLESPLNLAIAPWALLPQERLSRRPTTTAAMRAKMSSERRRAIRARVCDKPRLQQLQLLNVAL